MNTLKSFLPAIAFLIAIGGAFANLADPTIMKDTTIDNQCRTGTLIVPPTGCGTTDQGKGRCQVLVDSEQGDAYDSENQSCSEPLFVQ